MDSIFLYFNYGLMFNNLQINKLIYKLINALACPYIHKFVAYTFRKEINILIDNQIISFTTSFTNTTISSASFTYLFSYNEGSTDKIP